VTASVSPRLITTGDVELTYRVQYGSSTTIAMLDNGAGNDTFAGDSIYTCHHPLIRLWSGRHGAMVYHRKRRIGQLFSSPFVPRSNRQ
jgi:hypothetical protein